jgi:nicotinate phosphoribosyltransferase
MRVPSQLYSTSLALLTDFYQLTMAQAAWRTGVEGKETSFHLLFRETPFRGGYTIACGLEQAIDYVSSWRLSDEDVAYLAEVPARGGGPLFEEPFLEHLRGLHLACDIDAVPGGTLVFPQEPILRVRGPVVGCMLLESPLLNLINFPTLIATKAARVCQAARGDPVIEFGLRRAQGIDGALTASRAAYVGGCASTSNVLAGRLFGIPVSGTQAHSWVMLFGDEREAFRAFARAQPDESVFLVDTYHSLEGVRAAIEVGRELRAQGHEMVGIRLDSGDLAWLSNEARKLLDEAGFTGATITASNELDEHIISSLKEQGAKISAWGVGTRLVTGAGQGALGGVYKLSAVRDPEGAWQPRLKLSEQTAKISTPGVLQVRRFHKDGELVGDLIYDEELGCASTTLIDPLDPTRRKSIAPGTPHEDLLVPVVRQGAPVYEPPPLAEVRARTQRELSRMHAGIKRLVNPHLYPVGLEQKLHERRTRLILEARGAPA